MTVLGGDAVYALSVLFGPVSRYLRPDNTYNYNMYTVAMTMTGGGELEICKMRSDMR